MPAPAFPTYSLSLNRPPLPPLPELTVSESGRAHLHRSIWERFGLRPNQPIDLVPPVAGSPYWHLDLRPEAARRLSWGRDERPRIYNLPLPPGLVEPSQPLTLYLMPGEPSIPGFYPLLPTSAFYDAYLAFLEAAALAARTH